MPHQPAPPPIDPAWLAFRQQGAAMVARERGLTPDCRVKLARLARSLGIADDQVDAAIRSLGASEPAAPPNPQAERLRERLRKDLAGKRTIIGPAIEARIVATATTKYSLDEATVRQVLGDVAAELGLKRITASEALRNLAGQIDKAVGSSTWLAREGWDRLRIAGGKWGIELEVVDELIEQRLAANKQERSQRQFWVRATLIGTTGAAAIAALVILVLAARQPDGSTATVPPVTAPVEPAPKPIDTPAWWDVEVAVEMANVRRSSSGLAAACDLAAASSGDERAAGYERLLDHVAAAPADAGLLQSTAAIVAGCHALEPDEAAALRLRRKLLALLPAIDAPAPAKPEQLETPFWAAGAAIAAIHRRGAKAERRQAMADELGAALRTSFDAGQPRDEQLQLARTRTALALYQQLAAAAAKQPAAVADLHGRLWQRVERWLPEDELDRAEATLVAAALPTAGKHWTAYEQAIQRAITSSDPLNLLKLVDALRRIDDPELTELLSHLLLLRTGARPATMNKSDVIRAVRKAIGSASPGAMTAADRWLLLSEAADEALTEAAKPTDDAHELLQQSVELAHLTTLAMALAQGEAGYALFDAGIDQPPRLVEPEPVEEDPRYGPPRPRPGRTATASDQRQLAQFVELLSAQRRDQQALRQAALGGLARISAAFPDIDQPRAEAIATYLLARKNDEEFIATLPAVPDLRRWKRLRLAVADGLASSRLPTDKQRQLVANLVPGEVPDDASIDVMRRLLLEDVQRDLAAGGDGAPPAVGDEAVLLDLAATHLQETYLQRARLLSVSAADTHRAASPSQALELTLAPIGSALASGGDRTYLAELAHRQRAARYVGGDDLRQTVALQRLAVELSARRAIKLRPHQAAAARQIESEALAATADNVLHQLRTQEVSLLQLWMLYAVET